MWYPPPTREPPVPSPSPALAASTSTVPDTSEPLEIGLTDPLDPLLGRRFDSVRDWIDSRAAVCVSGSGVTVHGILRSQGLPWDRVRGLRLENRLDVAASLGLDVLPVGRVLRRLPLAKGIATHVLDGLIETATTRLTPQLRERAGWVLTGVRRSWGRQLELDGLSRLVTVANPEITQRAVFEATARGIPVVRT